MNAGELARPSQKGLPNRPARWLLDDERIRNHDLEYGYLRNSEQIDSGACAIEV
jgi:hypothetical protein